MIKNLSIILVLLTLMLSCGKKNDPIYNDKISKILNENLITKL